MKFTTLKKSAEEERSIFLSSKGKMEDDEDDEGSDGGEDVGDERAHAKLLRDLGKISTKKKPDLQREVRSSLGTVTSTIDTSNLLKRIGSKELKKVSEKQGKQSLPEPLEKTKARRLKRAAGYEKVNLEVKKWEKLVKNRRSAEQLRFPLQETGKKVKVVEASGRPEMKSKLEQEIYSLLLGAQLMEKPETEEEKEMKRALSLEEVKEKIRERVREREMKRRLEHKAYLQNKSKSRKYHQILRKERQRKQKAELEELQKTDPEAALEKLQEMDDLRVQERMSQRHSKSKWAHFQGLRAMKDDSAKAALQENARLRKELKAKLAKKEQDSDEEEEDDEDIEQEAGSFDPSNPWTASLDKKKKNPKTNTDDEGEESFAKFKKFWAEVNKRKEEDKKAMEELNKKKCEEEALEAAKTSQKEEETVDKNEEEEEEEDGEVEEEEEEDDEVEMEEQDEDEDDDESESMDEEDKYEDGESENDVEEGSDSEEDDEIIQKSKVKVKSNLNDDEGEGKVMKGKTTLKKSKKEVKKVQKGKKLKSDVNQEDDDENVKKTKVTKKKLKSDVNKGEEVKNTKKTKVNKKNLKLEVNKEKEETTKTTKITKKKLKSEINKEKEETTKNTNATKKKLKPDVNNEEQEVTAKKGKKRKKKSKSNEIQSEEVEKDSGAKKVKASVKRKMKPEEDNEEQEVKKLKKGNENKKKKSNVEKDTTSDGEDKNEEATEGGDIVDELTSVDYMFNKAEVKIQQKVKRKLAKLGVGSGDGEKWKKVGWKKKDKVASQGAVTIEEFDFSAKNNEENTIEGRERLRTLEDVEAFGNRKEGGTTDKTEQAVAILKKAAKTDKTKEKNPEGESNTKKKVEVDPKKFLQVNAQKIYTAKPDRGVQDGEGLDDSEEDSDGENPEDIIREAFADDYLIDEFKAEKKKILDESKAKTISYALPGWGSWAGPNIKVSRNKRRKYRLRVPEMPRKDKDLGNVIYNEDADVHKNLRKTMVSELPYMYSSVKDFEASVRAPVGRMFVPENAHRKLTLPPVITKLGTVIEPMSEDMLMNTAEAREIQKEKKKKNRKIQEENNENKGKNKSQGKRPIRKKTRTK